MTSKLATNEQFLAKRTSKQPDRLRLSMDAKKKTYAAGDESSSTNDDGVVVFPLVCGIDGCTFMFHSPNATGPHINNKHKGKANVFKGKMHRIAKKNRLVAAEKKQQQKRPVDDVDDSQEDGKESERDETSSDDSSSGDSSIESIQPIEIARSVEHRMMGANKKAKIEPQSVEKSNLLRMILKTHEEKQRLDAEQKALDSKEKELLLHLGSMELRRLLAEQHQN